MTDRIKRLESLFLAEIAGFISRYYADEFGGIITICGVEIKKNLQSAKVYYSLLGHCKPAEKIDQIFANIKYELVSYLAKRLRIKRVPALIFVLDKTAQKAGNLETLLRKIKDEDQNK